MLDVVHVSSSMLKLILYTLGNRKALVEKSGLVKHATSRKQKETGTKQGASDNKSASNRCVICTQGFIWTSEIENQTLLNSCGQNPIKLKLL